MSSYPIVCLCCGYHRTWTTMAEALADGRRHAEHHPPEPALPETGERRCPACQSERTVQEGRVEATGKIIKSERRCEACGTAFLFVRKRAA